MKIKKLCIKNFRSIQSQELELSRFNILYGANGAGKTSILNALRYVLNGELPKDPVRHGEESLSVSIDLDDGNGTTLGREAFLPEERRINGKVVKESTFFQYLQGVKASYNDAPYELKQLEHTNPFFADRDPALLFTFLEAGTVDGHKFPGIKELELELKDGTVLYRRASRQNRIHVNGKKSTVKAFADILTSYGVRDAGALDLVTSSDIMNRLNMADLGRYLLQNLPVRIDFDKLSSLAELDEEEKKVLASILPPAPEPVTMESVERAYGIIYDTRAAITANAQTELKKSIFEDLPPTETREEVNKKIAELNQKLGTINSLARTHQDYKRILDMRKNMAERLTYWEKQLADPKFNGLVQPDYQSVQAMKAAEETQRNTINISYANFYNMKRNVENYKKTLASIDTNRCPYYEGITCSTDRTGYRNQLVDQIKESTQSALAAQKNYQEAKRALASLTQQREALEARIKTWEEKCAVEAQIKTLTESMPAEPEAPQPIPDASSLQEEVAALNALLPKIGLYEESIRAKKAYETAMQQYSLYDGLVKKCNPKNGLLAKVIMEQVLSPFQKHCNNLAASIFPDSAVEFSMGERGLEAGFRPHGKDHFLSLDALSTGEKMQLTFILMDLVSTISGSRIMVFDNMESLDEGSLEHLLSIVKLPEVQGRYDHIIFSTVCHENIVKTAASIGAVQMIGV